MLEPWSESQAARFDIDYIPGEKDGIQIQQYSMVPLTEELTTIVTIDLLWCCLHPELARLGTYHRFSAYALLHYGKVSERRPCGKRLEVG